MDLGQRLRQARLEAGMTQEELGKQLGVSRQTLSNWENGRSLPDVGSAVKLGKLYNISLDKLLSGQEIIQQFEDLAARRRQFWQMMLEIGIILQLVGNLIRGLGFSWVGDGLTWCGFLLLTVTIVMHLRVFDHSRGDCIRGLLGIGGRWLLILWVLVFPNVGEGDVYLLLISFANLILALLVWSAGVWTINFKSTRLWLIIVLYVGTPLLLEGLRLQDSGVMVESNPFLRDYRVETVLYPQDDPTYRNAVIELGNNTLMLAVDGVDREYIGRFDYSEPTVEDTAKGIWFLVPEEDPQDLYKLTLEQDDSVVLSYANAGTLQWQWKLKPNHRVASLHIDTLAKDIFAPVTWYPAGYPDGEKPNFKNISVAPKATLGIKVYGLEGKPLVIHEEYYHEDQVDYQTYEIPAKREHQYEMEVEARYGALKGQYAIYRIPFEDGEYRFTLTLQGF